MKLGNFNTPRDLAIMNPITFIYRQQGMVESFANFALLRAEFYHSRPGLDSGG